MIVFKEKQYAESEAMRTLFVHLRREGFLRNGLYETIGKSQLPAVLKGNNVVVEKFVISTSFFFLVKYRAYLKMGAKVKLPDTVRLDGYYAHEKLGNLSFKFQKGFSELGEKLFGGGKKKKKKKKDNNDNNNNGGGGFSSRLEHKFDIEVDTKKLYGEVVKYDKRARELILEFDELRDVPKALDILPFGLNYKVYLLE